ncbi:hypothetical protein ACFPMF_03360 [Larkinella bovis]|uniref:Uncharacterized protein n=1 Tax=Larkinella bovis TaxID=683041 RepID=A0ABW0I751_9BACT
MKNFSILAACLAISLTVEAQQTIFNVPSSDITPANRIMAQVQVDFNREQVRSMSTLDYGLNHQWEIGLNLYHFGYQPAEHHWLRNDTTTQIPYAPQLLLNAQKAFDLTENLHLGLGGQTGINVPAQHKTAWVGWAYGNLAYDVADKHYKTVAGVYGGNHRYLADGPTVGIHLGIDAGIWYEKVHVLADWASGTHDYGQLMVGAEVYLGKHLPLALGWRRSNQDGEQALVLQLTYSPD